MSASSVMHQSALQHTNLMFSLPACLGMSGRRKVQACTQRARAHARSVAKLRVRMSLQVCPPGHMCRKGSAVPQPCLPLVDCPAGTELPDRGYTQQVAALATPSSMQTCVLDGWQGDACGAE
jgi:hypothetical protein